MHRYIVLQLSENASLTSQLITAAEYKRVNVILNDSLLRNNYSGNYNFTGYNPITYVLFKYFRYATFTRLTINNIQCKENT